MSVYDIANRLARALKKSEKYKDYKQIREKIMDDEKKLEMLKDYQQQQMKLQSKQLSGQELSVEEKERFENLREIIELNADIKKYLEAEYQISILLNDIQKIIFSDLDIGIQSNNKNELKKKEHPE